MNHGRKLQRIAASASDVAIGEQPLEYGYGILIAHVQYKCDMILSSLTACSASSQIPRCMSPCPMRFAPSAGDTREWSVEAVPAAAVTSATLRVSLHRLLIEAGFALTLAMSPSDPRAWFAVLRYGADFFGTAPTLRFYRGARRKDPRLTAVAAEEVATGVGCYILSEHLGLMHIINAFECLERNELRFVNTHSTIQPDYMCLDSSGDAVIAECKGAVGTLSAIKKRVDVDGMAQVQNVVPTRSPLRASCGRVVIGTHFCVEGCHPRSETTTIVRAAQGAFGGGAGSSDVLIRLAYAKVFRYAGRDDLAEGLLSRSLDGFGDALLREASGIGYLPIGPTAFGDTVALYEGVARSLFSSQTIDVTSALNEALVHFRSARTSLTEHAYGLPNGVIIITDRQQSR